LSLKSLHEVEKLKMGCHYSAALFANAEMILLYWDIGLSLSANGEKHFRKNTASFLNAIASCSMNGMCGIDRNLGPPLQGLFDWVYSYPGLRFAPLRAILSRTFGALVRSPKGQTMAALGNALRNGISVA